MPRSPLTPYVDRRKGDRHKAARKRTSTGSSGRSRWDKKHVVGWDGEGAEVDGVHVYNLMANSEGRYIHNDAGLSTQACLEFMLANNNASAINVIFSGGYDVNMILRDVPRERVEDLWRDGRCHWQGYRITYKPRKVFSVARVDPTKKSGYDRSFVLWDVFGFYQTSFVKACKKWLVDVDIIDQIDAMKQKRADFTTDDFAQILTYCLQECGLLVLLVQELLKALDKAGIRLTRFDGAGAIAGAMLRQQNVKPHIPRPEDDIYRAIQHSYAGGRIEAVRVGNYEGSVWKYDINSAYPSAALDMPSWEGATWQREQYPSKDEHCIASLVAVQYAYRTEQPFYPLFFRAHDGTILFPRIGAGLYWLSEYQNLADFFTEGEDYQVMYTLNCYSPSPKERPLAWIRDAYEIRRQFKREGDMAQEAIKLGINSVYGKFAQQEGYVSEIPGVRLERFPTYHCLAWASLITARTRSLMYRTAIQAPEQAIAFATDAVIGTCALDGVPVGDDLGEWSLETYSGCTLVQAGVYWLKDDETGEWYSKYRGFDAGSLSRDTVVQAWRTGDTTMPVTLTRFVGMGSALARTDFHGIWRTWHREDRTLDLTPKGKRQPVEHDFHNRLCRTVPMTNHDDGMSYPYKVVWVDGEGNARIKQDGVDVRVLEDEYEEGYL